MAEACSSIRLQITQVNCWDRGRPARPNVPRHKHRELKSTYLEAGGTPAVPENRLNRNRYLPFKILPTVSALHHLIRIGRQVHRGLRITFGQIADDIEDGDGTNEFAVFYQRNIPITLGIQHGHSVTDRCLRRQSRNYG